MVKLIAIEGTGRCLQPDTPELLDLVLGLQGDRLATTTTGRALVQSDVRLLHQEIDRRVAAGVQLVPLLETETPFELQALIDGLDERDIFNDLDRVLDELTGDNGRDSL